MGFALQIGERVRLRGREPRGVLRRVNESSLWAQVEWDAETPGPKHCHLKELERDLTAEGQEG